MFSSFFYTFFRSKNIQTLYVVVVFNGIRGQLEVTDFVILLEILNYVDKISYLHHIHQNSQISKQGPRIYLEI